MNTVDITGKKLSRFNDNLLIPLNMIIDVISWYDLDVASTFLPVTFLHKMKYLFSN